MKKLMRNVTAAALSLTLVTGQAFAKDSSKPIVIPTHNWSSQVVMAYVIGGIFENMGNNVEYVPADTQAVYEAIRNGDVTISHEVWQSTFSQRQGLHSLSHTLQRQACPFEQLPWHIRPKIT